MKAPCMGCTERAVGCHSTCPKYAEYQVEWEKFKVQRHNMKWHVAAEVLHDGWKKRSKK